MKIHSQKRQNKSLAMAAALLMLAACQASKPPAKASSAASSASTGKSTSETTLSQPAEKQVSADKVELKKNASVAAKTVTSEIVETKKLVEKSLAHNVTTPIKAAVAEKKMPVETKKPESKKLNAATVKSQATSTAKTNKTTQTATTLKSTAKKTTTVKSVAASFPSGDAAKGKLLARKCAVCHNFNRKKKVGPGLAGIFGREAGTAPGFKYKFTKYIQPGKAWHWDAAHLAAWDCDAKAAIKTFTGNPAAKTKMGVQHVCDAAKQADLIAFFKTL